MKQTYVLDIQEYEEKLQTAMLSSDVEMLNNLLASDLIFTNHLGQMMTKKDDLEAHSSGALNIDKIELSEQRIQILENVAIVTVQASILGSFAGESSESVFRFTRVWKKAPNDAWQVIVAHSCMVA